jgi:signal recognition particle GTPase
MTYARFLGAVLAALALSSVVIPSSLQAQEQEQTQEQEQPREQEPELPQVVQAQLRVYAAVYLAMVTAQDDFQREMGHSHDEQERDRLRQGFRERLAEILVENELTAEEYERITLQVSIDAQHRELFDEILEELSGSGSL